MAIEVNTSEYQFSHGHAPRGRGGWAFRMRCTLGSKDAQGNPVDGAIFWARQGDNTSLTYGEAKAVALAYARHHGCYRIEVCS